MSIAPPASRACLELQPLRIPAGWCVEWNALSPSAEAENGDFGGSSLFSATNASRRFNIDVAFEPEFDPKGTFRLAVTYQPWPRTEQGRRRREDRFSMGADAELVHSSHTRSYAELIHELELWIARCTTWVREEN